VTLITFFLFGSLSFTQPGLNGAETGAASYHAPALDSDQEGEDVPERLRHYQPRRQAMDSDLYVRWLRAEQERLQNDKAKLSAQDGADEPVWVPLGPTNGAGKMGPLVVHPTIAGTIYAAADGGGVWKTTDAGASWNPLGDGMAMNAVLSLAIAPSDPSVLYAGTGTDHINRFSIGAGLLKTTDGGESWSLPILADTNATSVNAIAVHPLDSQDVLIGTLGGGYRSTDGGATWAKVISTAEIVSDYVRDPIHPEVVYASIWLNHNQVLKSTDDGVTWADKSSGLTMATSIIAIGRMRIAISPSDPSLLYLATTVFFRNSDTGRFVPHIFKTTNGGESWEDQLSLASPPNSAVASYMFQNPRNNAIVVSPTDPKTVIAGGLIYIKSTNGGATWSQLFFPGAAMHVDAVDLAYQGTTLYIANDGGIWSSTDEGQTATPLNATLATRQYYQLAIDPIHKNRMLAGSQDNGTDLHSDSSGTLWTKVRQGDGADCAINPRDPSIAYATIFPPFSYFKTTNAGDPSPTWQSITPAFPSGEQGSNLVMDLIDPSTLYIGTYRVWRTTDDGLIWDPLPTTLVDGSTWGSQGSVSDLAIAPSNGAILLVAHSTLGLLRSRDGGNSWLKVAAPDLLPKYLNSVEIDPLNPAVMYVTYSEPLRPQVFMSTDAGVTWTPRATGLPPFQVLVLRADAVEASTLYAGTAVGVYRSTDQGATWSRFGVGLPNVQVNDMRLFKYGEALHVATYGRGVWELNLRAPASPAIVEASVSGKKLFVTGRLFDRGATILIKGVGQKTQNDDENRTTRLIAKKSGKRIFPGDKLQVVNADGTRSNELTFMRAGQ
jgi:photosystem II stability/assembly factor-like uncharacterized protein